MSDIPIILIHIRCNPMISPSKNTVLVGYLYKIIHIMYVNVCMCGCMYVCMHACMYACMHVCMHVCMYACMHVCMHACMYGCICIYNPYLLVTCMYIFILYPMLVKHDP